MINFNSGFNSVSEQTKQKIIDSINNNILEVGHRSGECQNIIQKLSESFRRYMNIPDNFNILFFQGGSSLQFYTINNFGKGAYITTGYWGTKAFQHSVTGVEIWNNEYIPSINDLTIPDDADFIHYCSNETITGLQFPRYEKFNKPVIVDCSSDFLTREINWNNVDMIYAHSQKNVGTVGVTVVIIKNDLMQTELDNIPDILSYKINHKHGSIYNTIPVFNFNVTLLSMNELIENFDNVNKIDAIYKNFSEKIYTEIEKSKIFYNKIKDRSRSTITFFIKPEYEIYTNAINSYFEKQMIKGINGHRSIGGYRLSIPPILLNDETLNIIRDLFSLDISDVKI